MAMSTGRIMLEIQDKYNDSRSEEMSTSMGGDFGNEIREAH